MCLKAGAPEKPKKGECRESHVTQHMIAEMAIALTTMMTLLPLVQSLNDRQV